MDVECGCSYWFWVHKLCRITTIKGTLQRKHLGLTFHLILLHFGMGGMITFLALAHMLDATQVVWGGGGGMITFLALARMLDATQMVWGGGGDDNVPCTCTHVGCCTNGLGWGGMIGCYTNGLGWGGVITFLGELSRIWWTKSSSARNFRPSKTGFFSHVIPISCSSHCKCHNLGWASTEWTLIKHHGVLWAVVLVSNPHF